MTENQRKFWKLALVAVPVVVANIGSYVKARIESRDDNKASYETLRLAVVDLQKNAEDSRKEADASAKHIFRLEGELTILKEMLGPTHPEISVEPKMPPLLGMEDAGVEIPAIHRKPPATANAALPTNFEDVIEQYKSKK